MPKSVEQTPWLTEGEEKKVAVRQMFADIAPSYDKVNSVMSFSLHHRWRKIAVQKLNLKPGDQVLDLCCGTGDFFEPIRSAIGQNGRLIGLDFCLPMLKLAGEKFPSQAELIEADACHIPLDSQLFDGATVGWGLRNVPDLDLALSEVARVLKPGAKFVSVDMARPNGVIGKISEWVFHSVVPTLGRLIGKTAAYQYLPKSTLKFASRDELKQKFEAQGFENVQYQNLFFGNICIHWGQKK